VTALPTAIVLTAGLGTRLWPLTARRAKPAVPLAGPTLVERILRQLVEQGVRDAVLNLHHHPASVTRVVGDGTGCGLRVRYSLEQKILGSAGGPRHALPLIDDDPFLIVNGDTLSEMDLGAMLDAHRRSGAEVTLGVVPNPAPDRYGGVVVDEDGAVRDFTRPGLATESWHFVGLQVANRSVFAGLEDGVAVDSVDRVYRDRLTSAPGTVRAFRGTGRFLDVGRPADYLDAALAMARHGDADLVCPGAQVAATARLRDTIVWPWAVIGSGATLTRCIVSDGVEIPAGFAAEGRVIVPASGLVPREDDRIEAGLMICPL
jgi:NDP-sugar pyrophosphorylase family protein